MRVAAEPKRFGSWMALGTRPPGPRSVGYEAQVIGFLRESTGIVTAPGSP
jgi:hypothetical protein